MGRTASTVTVTGHSPSGAPGAVNVTGTFQSDSPRCSVR